MPRFATLSEWGEFKRREKNASPLIYWLLEERLPRMQRIVNWPRDFLGSIGAYCHRRWIEQPHLLRTGIKPGKWVALSSRLLSANMNALVDYVEIEMAKEWVAIDRAHGKRSYQTRSRWWRSFRCPEAGLAYLAWEITLDQSESDPPMPRQAHRAREILAIYRWWKEVRPQRPDPMEASGLGTLYEAAFQSNQDVTSSMWCPPELEIANEKYRELCAAHANEDEAMLIRLMKIRAQL